MRIAIKKPVKIRFLTFNELWNIKQTFDNKLESAPNINYEDLKIYWEPEKTIVVPTLNGPVNMTNKDVLVIGVKGELYPCAIDIFKETYNYEGEL